MNLCKKRINIYKNTHIYIYIYIYMGPYTCTLKVLVTSTQYKLLLFDCCFCYVLGLCVGIFGLVVGTHHVVGP